MMELTAEFFGIFGILGFIIILIIGILIKSKRKNLSKKDLNLIAFILIIIGIIGLAVDMLMVWKKFLI